MIHYRFPSEKNWRLLCMPIENARYPQWEVIQKLMVVLKLDPRRDAIALEGLVPDEPVLANGQYVIKRAPPLAVPLAPILVDAVLPPAGVPYDTGARHA